jgi:transposase-like protein
MTKNLPLAQMTVRQLNEAFPDDEACKSHFALCRWPTKVSCPRCENDNVHPHTRPHHWQCYKCARSGGYRFSVLTGTIFENTNVPLRNWFRFIHLMVTSEQRLSPTQMRRLLDFGTYRTIWNMCERWDALSETFEVYQLVGDHHRRKRP